MGSTSTESRNSTRRTSNHEDDASKSRRFWIWYCCQCSDFGGGVRSGGMTTKILQCPNAPCHHERCDYCEKEEHKLNISEHLPPKAVSKQALPFKLSPHSAQAPRLLPLETPVGGHADLASNRRKRKQKASLSNTYERPEGPSKQAIPDPQQDFLYGCFFHIQDPEQYNPHTDSKYLPCVKPGWSLQHLVRDHLQSVHSAPKCEEGNINHAPSDACHRKFKERIINDEEWKKTVDILGSRQRIDHVTKWRMMWAIFHPTSTPPPGTRTPNPWARRNRASETPALRPFSTTTLRAPLQTSCRTQKTKSTESATVSNQRSWLPSIEMHTSPAPAKPNFHQTRFEIPSAQAHQNETRDPPNYHSDPKESWITPSKLLPAPAETLPSLDSAGGFNTSIAADNMDMPGIPPIPSCALMPSGLSGARMDVEKWNTLPNKTDPKPMGSSMDDVFWGLDSDQTYSSAFNPLESQSKGFQSGDFRNKEHNFDPMEPGSLLDFSSILEPENSLTGEMSLWKTKNDGNWLLLSLEPGPGG